MENRQNAIHAIENIARELGRYVHDKDQASFIWLLECVETIELYTGEGENSARDIFDTCKLDAIGSIAINGKTNGAKQCNMIESNQIAQLNTAY